MTTASTAPDVRRLQSVSTDNSASLDSLRSKYVTDGYVLIPDSLIPLPVDITSQIQRWLTGQETPHLTEQREGCEFGFFIQKGEIRTEEGGRLLGYLNDSSLLGFVRFVSGQEVTLGDAAFIRYPDGGRLEEHTDSKGTYPLIATLIKEGPYQYSPTLHIRNKTTGQFENPSMQGGNWLLLNGSIPHSVHGVVGGRRSFAIGFQPADLDSFYGAMITS